MKRVTINLPKYASILGAAEGAGFDASLIAQYVFDEFRGTASHDIPNAMIMEFEDIVLNFMDKPANTAMDFGIGYLKPYVTFAGLGMILGALGVKKSVSIGKVTIKYAM
jgi:hypothetical protein